MGINITALKKYIWFWWCCKSEKLKCPRFKTWLCKQGLQHFMVYRSSWNLQRTADSLTQSNEKAAVLQLAVAKTSHSLHSWLPLQAVLFQNVQKCHFSFTLWGDGDVQCLIKLGKLETLSQWVWPRLGLLFKGDILPLNQVSTACWTQHLCNCCLMAFFQSEV